jgi:RNA polymerase sigma-70 factor (ECF subfamily)
MHDGTWSWTQRSAETFPEVTDKPHYIDKRTCVLPVKLAPGKTYHISINSERFQNFKDEGRRPAIPYPLNFTTAK